jgi:hypothetical protein
LSEASDRPKRLPRLEPGSVFAGYRIESMLARGGMGIVYKAKDVDLDRTVALKIIAPEFTQDETAVARFKSEARIAASLEHPNIVPIHRGGEHDGILYLAMRFVPGTNLREILDGEPLDLDRTGRIITDVARALDVAHARGLVHRDVKPANILLSGGPDEEQVYLADFGLTKRLGSVQGDLTHPGAWVGTPDYVAPEQIQARDVDGRADVYSLGCVLYEMLTGHVAYPKGSDIAKLWAHVTDPPPLPSTERSGIVPAFDDIVAKATAKEPDDRYRSASELAAAVQAAIAEQKRADAAAAAPVWDEAGAPTRASGFTRDEVFAGGDEPPRGGRETGYDTGPPPAAVSPAAAPAAASAPSAPKETRDRGFARRRWPLVGAAAIVIGGVAAAAVLTGGFSSSSSSNSSGTKAAAAPAGDRTSGGLGPVPTNHVSANGNAVLRLNGTVATVTVTTHRLLDGAAHALHIHAGGRGLCPDKSAARLHNGHATIATKDGVSFYGSPVTALTTRGDTSPDSILAFNRFPKTGSIRYTRKINVGPVVATYIRKGNAVVVVHGVDYNHNGLYDGVLDRSDLNRSIPGEATAPALCGSLAAIKSKGSSGSSGKGSKTARSDATAQVRAPATETFTASLVVAPGDLPAWFCALPAAADRRTA